MKVLLASLILLGLSISDAHSETSSIKLMGLMPDWAPPKQYDYPFDGKLIERKIHPRLIRGECWKLFAKYKFNGTKATYGCAVYLHETHFCEIITTDRYFNGVHPWQVKRHEIGHCNGWRH